MRLPRPDKAEPKSDKRPQVERNAFAASAQVIASGLLFFGLYRYLLGTIGASSLGIWSLVLASTNVSRLGGFGLQGTAVRYVARYLARGERGTAARVVETSVLATAAVIGLAAAVAYPLVSGVLRALLTADAFAQARSILPYAFLSLWLSAVTMVVQSALDGCQRADIRSGTTAVANVLYVAAAVALVPAFGIIGLAGAQVTQSAVLLVWSWLRLRGVLPEVGRLPRRCDCSLFREMLGYGANVQAETVLWTLHDPLAKLLLSHFGSLAAVGYFEMAARLVQQLRSLVTAGFQVLIPVIADYHETAPERVRALYATTAQLLIYVAVPVFGGVIVGAPLIGRLWIGHVEPQFVAFLGILSVATLLNTLSVPAMNANFGTGHITTHTVAAALMALLNVALGAPAGYLWGGTGVVTAWALAMVAGSALVGIKYHRRTATPFASLVSPVSLRILAATAISIAVAAASSQAMRMRGGGPVPVMLAIAPVAYALLMLVPVWRHVGRERLLGALAQRLPWRRSSAP